MFLTLEIKKERAKKILTSSMLAYLGSVATIYLDLKAIAAWHIGSFVLQIGLTK